MSRLFDLQCNPQIVNGALGKLGAARPGLRLPGCIDAFEQGVRAIFRPTGERGDGGKIDCQSCTALWRTAG